MPTSSTPRQTRSRWLYLVVGLLGSALVVFSATIHYGYVNGEEFSPRSFQRRTFQFYEIPLVRLQVTPVIRSNTTNDLESQLVTSRWVQPQADEADSWDLVVGRHGLRVVSQGDAAILSMYLDARNEEDQLFWLEWSKAYADLAAILWPEVAYLAREQLYIFVPRLFRVALTAQHAAAFRRDLHHELALAHCEHAEILERRGNYAEAMELFARAARYDPDFTPAEEGRRRVAPRVSPASPVTPQKG